MRSLWPREHGAYVQLGAPLITGLILAGGRPAAVAFAVAAACLFLAHEPMAVIGGLRGVRLRDALVRPSRRRIWVLGALTALSVAAWLLLAPGRAWLWGALPAVPAAGLVVLFFVGRIKSLPGELLVALAGAAAVVPAGLSGGAPIAPALTASAVWLAVFVPSILAVHVVKAAHRLEARRLWLIPAATALATLVVVAALAVPRLHPLPALPLLGAVPASLLSLGVTLLRPHPRHLRRIGWSMAAAYLVTLVLLVL